jgi:hypothetical protein
MKEVIMKRNVILSVVLLFFAFSPNVFGQTAREAVMALKKLQTRCSIGLSYSDYSSALAEAKSPVKLYLESPEAKNAPALLQALITALSHYDSVIRVWGYEFTKTSITNEIYSKSDSSLYNAIKIDYPDVTVHSSFLKCDYIVIDEAISIIWSKAAGEVGLASDLLAKADKEPEAGRTEVKSDVEQLNATVSNLQQLVDTLAKDNEDLRKENENLKKDLKSLKTKSKKKKAKSSKKKKTRHWIS